jgi:SNF2 family DNA or RNA helicase
MGLGKTIQGIASMAIYRHEWPILVLCPSGARYHWETEFQQWLGVNSAVNKREEDDDSAGDDLVDRKASKDLLLEDSQIHVLGSSKDEIFPSPSTRVVICSYGLVITLVESGRLEPFMFPCAVCCVELQHG